MIERNYILSAELTDKMNIHTANISMLHKKLLNNGISSDIISMGNCNFINTKSLNIPKNIRDGIYSNSLMDMEGIFPITYIQKEFKLKKNEVLELVSNTECPEFEEVFTLAGKTLVRMSKEFQNKTKNCMLYPLSHNETMECYEDGDIDGYIRLSKNSYLTWYSIEGSSVQQPNGF